MKCFYHSDLDGQAAAFCVYAWVRIKRFPNRVVHFCFNDFRPINYGQDFPFKDITPGEHVWIVDYSIPPSEMECLLSITPNVTWIDHHKTAIENYADFPHKIRGIRQDGVAGCVLAWKYIHWYTQSGKGEERFGEAGDPYPYQSCDTVPVPRMLKLVGDRDVWTWAYGDETRFFFAGSRLHDTSPTSSFWWRCLEREPGDLPLSNTGTRDVLREGEKWWAQLLHDGEIIERGKARNDEALNASLGYEVEFEGYRCFACNRARVSSDRFGDRIKEYDILLPHCHDGKQWTVTLYSERVDVSEIAKARGGGGHKGASGFQCKELPWLANIEAEDNN